MGSGTANTARMMESLGRADTLPEVNRQQRAEDTGGELAQAKQQSAHESAQQKLLNADLAPTRSSDERKRSL